MKVTEATGVVWLSDTSGGCLLRIHAQPGAKKTDVAGVHGDALKIRLAAPPVDGKANAMLIEFLAKRLAVSRERIELVAGESSRQKRIAIGGLDAATVMQRLEVQITAKPSVAA